MEEIKVNGRTFYHVITGSFEEVYSKEGESSDSFHYAFRHKGFSWSIRPAKTADKRNMCADSTPDAVARFLNEQDIADKLIKK